MDNYIDSSNPQRIFQIGILVEIISLVTAVGLAISASFHEYTFRTMGLSYFKIASLSDIIRDSIGVVSSLLLFTIIFIPLVICVPLIIKSSQEGENNIANRFRKFSLFSILMYIAFWTFIQLLSSDKIIVSLLELDLENGVYLYYLSGDMGWNFGYGYPMAIFHYFMIIPIFILVILVTNGRVKQLDILEYYKSPSINGVAMFKIWIFFIAIFITSGVFLSMQEQFRGDLVQHYQSSKLRGEDPKHFSSIDAVDELCFRSLEEAGHRLGSGKDSYSKDLVAGRSVWLGENSVILSCNSVDKYFKFDGYGASPVRFFLVISHPESMLIERTYRPLRWNHK